MTSSNWLHFGGDPDLDTDTGILRGIFATVCGIYRAHCKIFAASAALAEVFGLRVLLLLLFFFYTLGNQLKIRKIYEKLGMTSNPCSHDLANCQAKEQRFKALYQDWASLKLVTGFAAFSRNINYYYYYYWERIDESQY